MRYISLIISFKISVIIPLIISVIIPLIISSIKAGNPLQCMRLLRAKETQRSITELDSKRQKMIINTRFKYLKIILPRKQKDGTVFYK